MWSLARTLSIAPKSIKSKLIVAFALMSLIPTFVFGYLIFYYIFPTINTFWDIFSIFIITIFLMFLGFCLAKMIIYPVVEIAAHARGIAEGKAGKELTVKREDEIGDLSGSLNRLSSRLKDNMSELHSYGEKIKQINMEINKKVLALSSLLQIGNLITSSADLKEILNLVVEKLAQLDTGGASFLLLVDADTGCLSLQAQTNLGEQARQQKIKAGQGLLGAVITSAYPLIIDAEKKYREIDEGTRKILRTKNVAAIPVTSAGRVIGILGIGNNAENFVFSEDQLELIGVFAKQVGLALENDLLMRKTEELAVKDELTGLYNESYIRGRLDEEIKRAITYQRPCSLVIFEVDNFQNYRGLSGESAAEGALKKVAQTLKESTSEIDKVARFTDHQFALVLPEKNKNQTLGLAENIRKEIERFGLRQDQSKSSATLTLSGGISSTPIDGTTAVELINSALYHIEKAKGEGANKVVIC